MKKREVNLSNEKKECQFNGGKPKGNRTKRYLLNVCKMTFRSPMVFENGHDKVYKNAVLSPLITWPFFILFLRLTLLLFKFYQMFEFLFVLKNEHFIFSLNFVHMG